MEDKILILICFVLIACLFYNQSNINESMADVGNLDQIKEAVKQVYMADVEAIRNLSNVATQLQAGGLTVPGNLTVKGELLTESGNFRLGNVAKDQWMFHSPPDDRGGLWIARVQRDGNVNWGNGLNLLTSPDGTQNTGGNFNIIPRGTILAFNDVKAPPGWALCDGANGTPDLRGRFIRMQSDSLGGFNDWGGKIVDGNKVAYAAGIGGNSRDDVKSWILNHRFGDKAGTDHQILHPNEIPPHTHPYVDAYWSEHWGNDKSFGNNLIGSKGGDSDNAPYTVNRNTGATGGGWGHNNQPPYYVLSYIMKL